MADRLDDRDEMNSAGRTRVRRRLLPVALVLALAWLAADRVASPEHWRDRLTAIAGAAVGKPVRIQGPLRWHLGAGPGLYAERVSLANPAWARRPAFAEADSVTLELSWGALLRGRFEVARLAITGLRVDLERRTDGGGNWSFSTPPAKPGEASADPFPAFEVSGLQVGYRGAADPSATVYRLADAHLQGGADRPLQLSATAGQPPIEWVLRGPSLRTLLGPRRGWPLQVRADGRRWRLEASLGVDLGGSRPRLEGTGSLALERVTAASAEQATPRGAASPATARPDRFQTVLDSSLAPVYAWVRRSDAALTLDLQTPNGTQRLSLTQADGLARVQAAGGTLTVDTRPSPASVQLSRPGGPVDLRTVGELLGWPSLALVGAADLSLEAHSQGATLGELLAHLRGAATAREPRFDPVIGPTLARAKVTRAKVTQTGAGVRVEATGDWRGTPFRLSTQTPSTLGPLLLGHDEVAFDHQLDLGNNRLRLQPARWRRSEDPPQLSARLTLSGPDPSTLNPLLGQDLPPKQPYRIGLDLQTDGIDTRLDKLEARIGATVIAGALELDRSGPTPRLSGRLRIPSLSAPSGDPPKRQPAAGAPVSLPTGFNADLRVTVERVEGGALPIAGLTTRGRLQDGTLTLDPLSFELAGLKVAGSATLENRQDRLAARASVRLAALRRSIAVGRGSRLIRAELQTLPGHLAARTDGRDPGEWLDRLKLDGRLDGLTLETDGKVETRLERLRLVKRPGQPLTVDAGGTFRQRPLTIKQQLVPATGKRPGRFDLDIASGDLHARLDGRLTRHNDLAEANFELTADRPDSLPLLLQQALGRRGPYRLSGKLRRTTGGYRVDPVSLHAGDNDLSGYYSLTDAPAKLVARLASRHFQVDLQAPAGPADDPRVIPTLNLIPQIPAGWDADYHLDVDRLVIGENRFDQFRMRGTLRGGHLLVDTLQARLPERGYLSARLDANLVGDRLHAHLSGHAKGLDLGWMLTKDDGPAVPWPTTIDLDLSGVGRDLREYLAGANGAVRFLGGPMALDTRALDLWTLSLLKLAVPPLLDRPAKAEPGLRCSVAGFRIAAGIMNSEGLLFDTRSAVILGSGSIDLRNETLDLLLTPKKKRFALLNITTPVTLRGTLADPKPGVAPQDLALTAGNIALRVFQPWILGADLVDSGYRVDNPCLKTFQELAGPRASGGSDDSPFQRTLRNVGRGIGRLIE